MLLNSIYRGGCKSVGKLPFIACPALVYLPVILLYSNPSSASGPAAASINSFYLLKLLLTLLFVLGIFLLLAKVVRQLNGVRGTSTGSLSIIASLSVGTRERVVIVKVGDDQILLGVSPSGIVKLQSLENPIAAESEPGAKAFKTQLNGILGNRIN